MPQQRIPIVAIIGFGLAIGFMIGLVNKAIGWHVPDEETSYTGLFDFDYHALWKSTT